MLVLSLWMACGADWEQESVDEVHGAFPLTCGHAAVSCDTCHPPQGELMVINGTCRACHEAEWPPSHDTTTTANCAPCHDPCGWD